MPRGYGTGRGARWWYQGRGYCWPGYPVEYPQARDLPKDVTYVGPCRCGFGPHAYYRTADGKIVHGASLPDTKDGTTTEPEPEHDGLQTEVERLRTRVKELEDKLKATSDLKKR